MNFVDFGVPTKILTHNHIEYTGNKYSIFTGSETY